MVWTFSAMDQMLTAKKMTPAERKALERSGKKHKGKTKVWVKISDPGSKTKGGKWAGNATFQWKGEDEKHAEEIPLRVGDKLKLKGKDLWVHPKHGEAYKFGAKEEEEAEVDPEDEDTDPDLEDEEETEDEEPAPKKSKRKPAADEDEDEDELDEEGLGPLTPEEIAEEDEAAAIAAEEAKIELRKQALAADRAARKAIAKSAKLREQVGQMDTRLTKQVEQEGIEKTGKSVAGKLLGLAGKLALKGFLKVIKFLGAAILTGSKAIRQLGPAVKSGLAEERQKLLEAQEKGESDVLDAEFTVMDKNLQTVIDDEKLLGPALRSGPQDMHGREHPVDEHGWPKGTESWAEPHKPKTKTKKTKTPTKPKPKPKSKPKAPATEEERSDLTQKEIDEIMEPPHSVPPKGGWPKIGAEPEPKKKAKKAKKPAAKKKPKKPKPAAEVEAALHRLEAALLRSAKSDWELSTWPSHDSLDRMPDEPESLEKDIKDLRQLARAKGNDLSGVNLRLLANALESGGLAKAVRLLKTIERSMDEDDFSTFMYLLPNSLLRNFR